MTGETLAGLGSPAAILYYNDFVTYPDNTTEPTDLLLSLIHISPQVHRELVAPLLADYHPERNGGDGAVQGIKSISASKLFCSWRSDCLISGTYWCSKAL